MLDQRGNIFTTFRQRGDEDRHNIQPIIEILPEPPRIDFIGQGPRAGGQHTHVDFHQPLATDAGEALVGQDAQDFALRRHRHVGDFIEKERPAMRPFKQSRCA